MLIDFRLEGDILNGEQAIEIYKNLEKFPNNIESIIENKEKFSILMLNLLKEKNNLSETIKYFNEEILSNLLDYSNYDDINEFKSYEISKKLINNISSPIEASIGTFNILKEAEEIGKILKYLVVFVGLSGSANYGPFYSPKAQIPIEMFNKNSFNKKTQHEISDIDLIITYKDIDNLLEIITKLVSTNKISNNNIDRFYNFKTLKEKQENLFFTIKEINPITLIETSIHFFTEDELKNELKFKQENKETVSFRTTKPNTESKNGNYSLVNIKKLKGENITIRLEYNILDDNVGILNKVPSNSFIDGIPYVGLIGGMFGKGIYPIYQKDNFGYYINNFYNEEINKSGGRSLYAVPNFKGTDGKKMPRYDFYKNKNYSL